MVQTDNPRDLGLVYQCNLVKCIYNKSQECTAGAVKITFEDNLAQCYTYTQEPVSLEQVAMGVGDVSQCDVIDCTYNVGQGCKAQTITVTSVDSVPVCYTYTTSSEAID